MAISAGCCEARTAPRPFDGGVDPKGGEPFVLVGDLQTTSMLEFWREENDVERSLLVKKIASARPAFVVMLGDLVSNGSSASAWVDFDDLCAPIRDARIPVLAVPGNHEYWLFRGGLDHYFARFPHLARRSYYEATYGPLRLLFLNSNKTALEASVWASQLRFYREALARADADSSVRGVLVLLHHPPYTNSTVTGDEAHVKREIVPAFFEAKKTLAMITGHVHSYEHFYRNGKTFLVSGGGGGPRAELALGERRRHADDLFDGPGIRAFHYLNVKPSTAGLSIDVVALVQSDDGALEGDGRFSTMDHIEIPWVSATESSLSEAPIRELQRTGF